MTRRPASGRSKGSVATDRRCAMPPDIQNIEVEMLQRLAQIEQAISLLARQTIVKDFYTTEEVAALLGKSAFTVREWCRLGRVRASKRLCGRGRTCEWLIGHPE